jgi:hypothetical protein
MAQQNIDLSGMSADQAFSSLQKAGLSASDASILISEWIRETVFGGPRAFNYSTAFPGVNHDCEVSVTRTFSHTDWADGVDVVQAEETISEQGFNKRFHAIEHDLDALAAGLAKISLCMAGLRANLRSLLDEIKAELNRLESMLTTDTVVVKKPPDYTVKQPPVYIGTTEYFGKDVHVFETNAGVVTVPTVNPVELGGAGNVRVQRAQSLGKLVAQDKRIQDAIQRGGTKADLVKQFGNVRSQEGPTFGELIDILPDTAKFESPTVFVTGVANLEASALRTTPSGIDSVAASLGTRNFAEAPIDRLQMIPVGAVQALQEAGIDTVSKLLAAGPDKVAGIASKLAPGVTGADAAGWDAAAGMLAGMTPQRG